jgi:hypothetical protein
VLFGGRLWWVQEERKWKTQTERMFTYRYWNGGYWEVMDPRGKNALPPPPPPWPPKEMD